MIKILLCLSLLSFSKVLGVGDFYAKVIHRETGKVFRVSTMYLATDDFPDPGQVCFPNSGLREILSGQPVRFHPETLKLLTACFYHEATGQGGKVFSSETLEGNDAPNDAVLLIRLYAQAQKQGNELLLSNEEWLKIAKEQFDEGRLGQGIILEILTIFSSSHEKPVFRELLSGIQQNYQDALAVGIFDAEGKSEFHDAQEAAYIVERSIEWCKKKKDD